MLCVSTFWNHLCKQAYKSTNDNVGQTVQNYFLNVFLSCHDVMWSNFLIWCFAMTLPLKECLNAHITLFLVFREEIQMMAKEAFDMFIQHYQNTLKKQ